MLRAAPALPTALDPVRIGHQRDHGCEHHPSRAARNASQARATGPSEREASGPKLSKRSTTTPSAAARARCARAREERDASEPKRSDRPAPEQQRRDASETNTAATAMGRSISRPPNPRPSDTAVITALAPTITTDSARVAGSDGRMLRAILRNGRRPATSSARCERNSSTSRHSTKLSARPSGEALSRKNATAAPITPSIGPKSRAESGRKPSTSSTMRPRSPLPVRSIISSALRARGGGPDRPGRETHTASWTKRRPR